MILKNVYPIEEIKKELKGMTAEQCINNLVRYTEYYATESDFKQKIYYDQVVNLIKDELLIKIK